MTGKEAKAACGAVQMVRGVEAVIEGGIHAMRFLWEKQSKEEDSGFFLIDARNAFNEENRTSMLWAVRHECPSGAHFIFNCYLHWATIVVRNTGDGPSHLLHSKEVVNQGYPLSMIAYSIGVLPLLRELRGSHPCVTHPWYADDAGTERKFEHI